MVSLMHNKNNTLKIKKGYVKIPNRIFKMGLSPIAVLLYCFFLSLAEEFNPGLAFIVDELKISKNTVIKYIKELENRNIIVKVQKGYPGKFSRYSIVMPSQWLSSIEKKVDPTNGKT